MLEFSSDNEQQSSNNPSPVSERRVDKAVKLAPFKFPFSKMSKSRSSDKEEREKDKEKELEGKMEREKHHGKEAGGGESETEEEEEENPEDGEENARGRSVQLPMSQLQLSGETQSNINSPILASNSVMVRNEQAIPSSPPPSYEHVIEQVKIWMMKLQSLRSTLFDRNPLGERERERKRSCNFYAIVGQSLLRCLIEQFFR